MALSPAGASFNVHLPVTNQIQRMKVTFVVAQCSSTDPPFRKRLRNKSPCLQCSITMNVMYSSSK